MTRALLVAACLAFFALCLLGMQRGWSNRGRRQIALPDLPAAPTDLGKPLAEPISGLYVGSTHAGQWQDRVVANGLGARADAWTTLTAAGVMIDRSGAAPVFIAAADIVSAGVGAGLAGKVMGPGGLLIIRWRLGSVELDTALRADDKSVYPDWVDAIDALVAGMGQRNDKLEESA